MNGDEKLTTAQKILRPLINFLVERYFPNGCFYGVEYITVFDQDCLTQKWGCSVSVAAAFLTSSLRDMNAEQGSFEFYGVTCQGDPVGDWKLTVERLDK